MQDALPPTRVLVLDNGAHSIKAAWADPAHPSLDPQVVSLATWPPSYSRY
jgi:hypothetical protein